MIGTSRSFGKGADAPDCLTAVHDRHDHVHQDQVRRLGHKRLQACLSVFRLDHGESQRGKHLYQNLPVGVSVVHHQNPPGVLPRLEPHNAALTPLCTAPQGLALTQ